MYIILEGGAFYLCAPLMYIEISFSLRMNLLFTACLEKLVNLKSIRFKSIRIVRLFIDGFFF